VDLVEFAYGFDFDDDFVVYEEVCAVFADNDILVNNLEPYLFLERDTTEGKFMGVGGLVNCFQEAWAEYAVDFHRCADNLVG